MEKQIEELRTEADRIRYEQYLEEQQWECDEDFSYAEEDHSGYYSKEEQDAEIWHSQYAEFDR